MNDKYIIITDKEKLREFIEWLPDLKNDECYYVCLFARSKYAKEYGLSSDKQQLKRFTTSKEYLIEKLEQLEIQLDRYYQKHSPIPQQALAVYITPNPRSYVKATKESLKKFVDLITNEYNGYNPHQEVLSQIQVACGTKKYFDLDFDNTTIEEMKPMIDGKINEDCLTYVQTRGGFHLLVELEKIEKQYIKNWYNNLTKLPNCDVRGDNLLPIPGTYQGGFTPVLLKN